MRDSRQRKLARILVEYSTGVASGDVVMLQYQTGTPVEFVREVQTAALRRGARCVRLVAVDEELEESFYRAASPAALAYFPKHELEFMESAQVYIGIGAPRNNRALGGVPAGTLGARQRLLRPILDRRVNHTRWVVTRYPTPAQAQDAGMSFADFEDFYFRACLIDWARIRERQEPLRRLLAAASEVAVKAPDTDLRFSVSGIGAVSCHGDRNMPDGEVYTAPVAGSVEGTIVFNTVCERQGRLVVNPRLVFRAGRVEDCGADRGAADLEAILSVDPGARVPGEFSFGLNRRIRRPTGNTLFDEKIAGSVHLALGSAYEDCDNGNRSALHWDLVRLCSDAEIRLDGVLVQTRGRFVLPELAPLNRMG